MLRFEGKLMYLCCGHTDMRKSFNGLTLIVKADFKLEPQSAAVFVFCNKKRDRIKVLEWDEDGFWVHAKRLTRGRVPWRVDGTNAVEVSSEELATLLNSSKLMTKLKGWKVGQYIL